MTQRFDLLVIGGGSGGLAHAQRAAEYGVKAAVVEYKPLGGTCVNVGCVPKKVMWYAAHHAHQMHHAKDYGYDVAVNGHDWRALKSNRDAYIRRLNGINAIGAIFCIWSICPFCSHISDGDIIAFIHFQRISD